MLVNMPAFMFNFLHTYHPQAILVSLGPIHIYWYGLLMVVGVIGGFLIAWRLTKFYNIKPDHLFNLAFYGLVFGLIGARIYYVAYLWDYYSKNLWDIFKIWQGGLAIHGILIGGFTAIWFYCRKNKLNFWFMADLVAIGLSFGQIIGRWGNYFNQEVFGRPTDLPWGIPIDLVNRVSGFENFQYFHPTFLYESAWNLIVFVTLLSVFLMITKKRLSISNKLQANSYNLNHSNVFFLYLVLYSLGRFFIEFLRIDPMPMLFGLRWAQIMSLGIISVSVIVIIYRNIKIKKSAS
jgi:phosphatidylglycerol:prolipoprotein diacylglycerol transferase